MRKLTFAPATLALILTSCAMGPDYRRPTLDVPAAFVRATPDRRHSELAGRRSPSADEQTLRFGSAELVDTTWWSGFGDHQLDALIRIALDENKDLRIAAYRIQQFDAMLQVSRAAGLPQLKYGATRARDTLSQNRQVTLNPGTQPVDNNYEIGVWASWELDLWGRIRRSNEAAIAELLATEEDRRALVISLVAKVATTYMHLLSVDRTIELLDAIADRQREGIRLLDAKFQGGRIPELPVVTARAELEGTLAVLIDQEREAAMLENALSLLIGRNPGSVKRGGSLETLTMPAIPAGVPAQVLAQRPDVRKAEQELVAANARIGIAKAQYLPTVSLTGHQGFASSELNKLLMLSSNFASFGVALLGPLFDGGRIAGGVREAEAMQRESATAYLRSVQTALHEVEDALVWHRQVHSQAASRARQIDELLRQVELTRKREEGGVGDLIEVTNAERVLYEGQLTQSQTRRDQALALIAVYKAMGGSWSVADYFPADLRTTKAEDE